MRKTALAIVFLAAMFAHTAHAQHFDWVKSYTGTDRPGQVDNWIVGSVTDSDGNLYILGQCASNAQLDGISLVPYGYSNRGNILIAKISPNGDILWDKVISSPGDHSALSIKMEGDSSIICMVNISLKGQLFYLDTLYQNAKVEIMPSDSLDARNVTAFITLDLDGVLQEHHFLQIAYIDSNDNLITTYMQTGNPSDSNTVTPQIFSNGDFCIDQGGNIYVSRRTYDEIGIGGLYRYSIENGLLAGYQIWVDGHSRFNVYPEGNPSSGNISIVKFTRHFNDMIGVSYLFENESGMSDITIRDMECDGKENVYIIGNTQPSSTDSVTRDLCGLTGTFTTYSIGTKSFLAKYDKMLRPLMFKYLNQYDDPRHFVFLEFFSMAFNDARDTLFVSGTVEGNIGEAYLSNGEHLNIANKAFFICFDTSLEQSTSYGIAQTVNGGTSFINCGSFTAMKHSITAGGNRVFIPIQFIRSIAWADSTIQFESSQIGFGVYIWDYAGHPINFIHIKTTPTTQHLHGVLINLHDSTLYFSGHFEHQVQAYFGDDSVICDGRSTAYVSKYVDTSFMTPYVYRPQDTGDIRITLAEDGTDFVAYPNPFQQRISILVENGMLQEHNGIVTATLTDLAGHREEVSLSTEGNGQYSLDLSSRPTATYFLTLTTADGHPHTLRLMKQSEVFRQ